MASSPAPGPSATPLLGVEAVDVHIGAQQLLYAIDLDVDDGEVVAVLGPNGAGKTTLLRTLAGLQRPSRGTISMRGRLITTRSAAERVEMGITFVPSEQATFPNMSVWDNLLVACHRFAWDRDRVEQQAHHVLDLFPWIGGRLEQRAGSLSGGEQQMLALAKGLLARPSLLLIDEVFRGLAPAVINDLLAVIRGLRAAGTTMVLVEQSPAVVADLADRVISLDRGSITPL